MIYMLYTDLHFSLHSTVFILCLLSNSDQWRFSYQHYWIGSNPKSHCKLLYQKL